MQMTAEPVSRARHRDVLFPSKEMLLRAVIEDVTAEIAELLRSSVDTGLARWQYERYARIVAAWCQEAASNAGETCAAPFDTLARVLVAGMDGLILQFVCDPDVTRARGPAGRHRPAGPLVRESS
jgi:AcrR family transcriptional regulator